MRKKLLFTVLTIFFAMSISAIGVSAEQQDLPSDGVSDDGSASVLFECQHLDNKLMRDRDSHWYECKDCGHKFFIEMHTFEDGVCTFCGEEETLYGDANGDGKIDSKDIILLKKYIANLENGKSSVTLGHKVVIDPGYPATCTQNGLTDGKKCADCGKILASQEVIYALGHIEGDMIIDVEPTDTASGAGHTECISCGETIRTGIQISALAGDYAYIINDDGKTCTITGFVGKITDGTLIIPATLSGYKVTSIGERAFSSREDIISVVIPSGVKSIESVAFSWCENLEVVTLPESITSIGDNAFYSCEKLKGINLPDSLTSIGSQAFSFCKSLESINIPDGVTSIGSHAFSNCEKLKSIVIPNGITSIKEGTLGWCTNLESVTIPDSVTSIGKFALYGCENLASIDIPDGVKSIGDDAFGWCVKLKGVDIPDSVTTIGDHAFYYCGNLESLHISESITSIGKETFFGCTVLTNVTIPSGVTSIGERAFCGCAFILTITIPDSVTSIGSEAFSMCCLYDVYYGGSAKQWSEIVIGEENDDLIFATIHYNTKLDGVDIKVDGDVSDWEGLDKLSIIGEGSTAPKKVDFYAVSAADGIYLACDVYHDIYADGDKWSSWWQSTNFEFFLSPFDSDKSTQWWVSAKGHPLDGSGSPTIGAPEGCKIDEAVMLTRENEGGTAYHTTIEVFISYESLPFTMVKGGNVSCGMGWKSPGDLIIGGYCKINPDGSDEYWVYSWPSSADLTITSFGLIDQND